MSKSLTRTLRSFHVVSEVVISRDKWQCGKYFKETCLFDKSLFSRMRRYAYILYLA